MQGCPGDAGAAGLSGIKGSSGVVKDSRCMQGCPGDAGAGLSRGKGCPGDAGAEMSVCRRLQQRPRGRKTAGPGFVYLVVMLFTAASMV